MAKRNVVVFVGETYFALCFYIRSRLACVNISGSSREDVHMVCIRSLSLSLPPILSPSLSLFLFSVSFSTCIGCVKTSVPDDVLHIDRERRVQRQTRSLRSVARQIKRTKVRVLDFEFCHRLRKCPSMARFKRALCFISFFLSFSLPLPLVLFFCLPLSFRDQFS